MTVCLCPRGPRLRAAWYWQSALDKAPVPESALQCTLSNTLLLAQEQIWRGRPLPIPLPPLWQRFSPLFSFILLPLEGLLFLLFTGSGWLLPK